MCSGNTAHPLTEYRMKQSRSPGEPHGRSQYWLQPHVHVCATPDGVIALDLKKDRYMGFSGPVCDAAAAIVSGWPVRETRNDAPATLSSGLLENAAQALTGAGLLVTSARLGKCATPVTLARVDMMPIGEELLVHPDSIRTVHVINFLSACVAASAALRFRNLEVVVNKVRLRKARAIKRGLINDQSAMRELTAVFRLLRGFAFTGVDRCLFHALALTNFLAQFDQFPTWVIGVKTDPFAAHSWVQEASLVLDDSPEEICLFSPLLAI